MLNNTGGLSSTELLEISEGLLQLDPVRTYPQRGAALVARLAGASAFRLNYADGSEPVLSDPPPFDSANAELPLRFGRQALGSLYLTLPGDDSKLAGERLRLARWGARVFSRGLSYVDRLSHEQGRHGSEDVEATLNRSPLTPREKDVVSLLVGGASTRAIASEVGLTIATVNTYLKRIFAKLGVHSRVELVARMAGTVAHPSGPDRASANTGATA